MDICPYCGTRNPLAQVAEGQPPRCHECGGIIDDLSKMATQIAMGPWFFRTPGKPYGPGCDVSILRKLLAAGRVKADSPLRGPATNQLWRRVRHIPGIAHLAGVCHACGDAVKADNKFCPSCGEKFTVPEGRNEWGLPTEAPSAIIRKFREKDAKLCPMCGHNDVDGDDCAECGTVFAPQSEATQVTLGGWFIRNKAHDYKPGVSIEQVQREIAAGLINSRTAVRGPSTEQFWEYAKSAAGVANLTGVCHTCGEKTEPDAKACAACGASFALPGDPNWIGLRYPTADAAAGAQKQLDAELAKIAATMPAQPARPAREEVADVAEVVDEGDFEGAEPGEEYDHDYVHDATQAHHHEEETAEETAEEPHHTQTADAGGFDTHAEAGVDPTDAADRRDRRKVEQLQKSQSTLITLLIVTPLVLIGAFFALKAISNSGDAKDSVAADGGPKDQNPPVYKATPSDTAVAAKKDAENLWASVKDTPRNGKFTGFLAEAELVMVKANDMFAKEQFLEAEAEFKKIAEPVSKVKKLTQDKMAANTAKNQANAAMESARQLDAPNQAKDAWEKAQASFKLGSDAYEKEEFDQADVQWDIAVSHFDSASKLVQIMRNATDIRAAVEREALTKYTREALDAANIPAWQAFIGKLKAGEEAAEAKNFEEARNLFEQARLMIPSVEFAMQLEIGRNYFAYQCGRLTARILKAKGSGHHPDEEMLAQLKRSYENMQINRDFFNRVPKSKNASPKELGEVMVVDCAKEIESAFENGKEVSACFGLGIHMVLIDGLLRADIGKLAPATRQDLELYLRKVMPESAKDAKWAKEFQDFLVDALETLGTEQNIPTKTREKWAKMTETLDKFEDAMKIVSPK
ncbi:MAG: hypothetical protein WD768_05120 [Phycisphaeraceae bacterium]